MDIYQNRIYCVLPFYFDCPFSGEPDSLWINQTPKIDTDALYSFVYTGSLSMRIFGIDFDNNPNLRKFWQQISEVLENDGTPTGLTVKPINANTTSWRSPRLVLSGSGREGMLILPLEIGLKNTEGENLDTKMVCQLVNLLQKFDSGQTPYMSYCMRGKVTTLQDRLDKDLGLCFRKHVHSWTLCAVAESLLKSFGDKHRMFRPYRFHIITYILGDPHSEEVSEETYKDFLRTVHCQNEKYHVDLRKMDDIGVMRTFENIHIGVADEGTCVLAIKQHDSGDFFLDEFSNGPMQTRLLWIYFLLMNQRNILLDENRRLSMTLLPGLSEDTFDSTEAFFNVVRSICSCKLYGDFSSISGYTHYNELYRYIANRLGVKGLYEELDGKLNAIDTLIKMVEEKRRHRFEIFVQTGSVVLGALALLYALPQAIPAVRDLWNGSHWGWLLICGLPVLIASVFLILMVRKSRK